MIDDLKHIANEISDNWSHLEVKEELEKYKTSWKTFWDFWFAD